MQAQTQSHHYLDGLNDAQRSAVEAIDGPVLVLAGAGTGKTRVLTTRLAHILDSNAAFPGQILAVTFTNKAAQEMKDRVSSMLGGLPVEGWWLGTFHALNARMLRRHADLVGLSSNFSIIDPDDQTRLLKQLMEAAGIDVKKWPAKGASSIIERWKDQALTPDQISAADAGEFADGRILDIYKTYQKRLREINACDFGDLILHMITIFKDAAHNDVLAEYHRQFRYIMVDEYQDTNVAQYLWLRLLAQGSANICCVGDDDQSIYGWRGAEVGNILKFEKDFQGAKIVRLEQNYRSTGHILAAASSVINHNENRLGKTLWSDGGDGEKLVVKGLWDGDSEARWIGEKIEELQHKGQILNQIAILVRAGFQMRSFEERLIALGINYRVIGGPRFYERAEIRDALAYLRVTTQPNDDLAFERIINLPKRGIGKATIEMLYAHARGAGISLFQAVCDLCETDELRPKVKETLAQLTALFISWRDQIPVMPHNELCALILEESGYNAMLKADKAPEAAGRLENLKEMVAGMEEYDSLEAFLEHVALVLENREKGNASDAVTLITLHGAKGLEYDNVFLPGWEEGLFPSQRAMDETGLKGLEEERRLAYVGITRARKRAFISFVANRQMYGSWVNAIPSRFVAELPDDAVLSESDMGFAERRSSHWDSSASGYSSNNAGANSGFGGNIYARRRSAHNSHPTQRGLAAARKSTAPAYTRGQRVVHRSFGEGEIIYIDGQKLDILFDDGQTKRVMASFIESID
ncbi:MAG: UvrD-helicase domain-containing protein [Alphaproteobacteria bacterium]|nr:UvrD-helicase domain-containing protein [Alphaproteobacteria bacterium]